MSYNPTMMLARPNPFTLSDDYEVIRPLTISARVYLCRERASGRLLVIKKFEQGQKKLFTAELAALEKIIDWQIGPRCFFALQKETIFFLGQEFCNGITLLEGKTLWSEEEKQKICLSLHKKLQVLHEEVRYAHLDLSPNNILVRLTPEEPKIYFLDWELSCGTVDNCIDNFSPRGTPGYMTNNINLSLIEKDCLALDTCIKFMDVGKKNSNSEKKNWLPWI